MRKVIPSSFQAEEKTFCPPPSSPALKFLNFSTSAVELPHQKERVPDSEDLGGYGKL